ncbi:hypothetical protein DYY65_10830 [Nitrososphaera sp. AFS]|jgi:hypothetical protein|nr:hypothetical protein [Nitrososphaera sp. AFS]
MVIDWFIYYFILYGLKISGSDYRLDQSIYALNPKLKEYLKKHQNKSKETGKGRRKEVKWQ